MKIKPGHRRALEIQKRFAEGEGDVVVGLKEMKQDLREGGWIPWAALVFGLVVFFAAAGGLFHWLGRTVVVVEAQDAGLKVAVNGDQAFSTVAGKQSIGVAPGDQTIKVSSPGLETVTRTFPLSRGQTQRVLVSIVDKKILVTLDGRPPDVASTIPEKKLPEKHVVAAAPPAVVRKPTAPPAKPHAPAPKAEPTILVGPFDEAQARHAQEEWAKRLKVPVEVTNSLGMKLRLIPPGDFSMGAPNAGDSMIPHPVRITRPYYLGVYEVTRGEFEKFVSEFDFKTQAEKDRGGVRLDNAKQRTKQDDNHQYTWRAPGFKQDGTHPVVDVSWDDMQAFCAWLSRKEGTKYRLPTEAEWEYASRAGTTHWNYNGKWSEEMVEIGNVPDSTAAARFPRWKEGTRSSDGFAYTSPVGRFRPNNFGLYDTLGNVFEWCSDWDDPNFYHHSPRNDPQGPPSGSIRIARGGSFVALVPVHGRWAFAPEIHLPDLGFRLVREIPGSPSIPRATSQEPVAPSAAGARGSR